jgi:hypothetical protein
MLNTNWKRLLGILLAVPTGFLLPEFLLSRGRVLRGKGFPAPLIDSRDLPASIACGAICVVGVCLFILGSKKAGSRSDHAQPSDDVQES